MTSIITLRNASLVGCLLAGAVLAAEGRYQPTWESLDARPTPKWFTEARFGIFIHWGVYSVPAWGPKGKYSEWYWHDMQDRNGQTWNFHARMFGEHFRYQDFAPQFKAELFDADAWAKLFAESGARYVVLTSKHHEGFALWPSAESWNWNSVDIGPHRDLCGELTKAVKAAGLKMGFYYSLYEWFHPTYRSDPKRYVAEHMLPQFKDLVTRYEPSIIWPDGEWEHEDDVWRSREFLAWLFNESPVRDEVAVNDRWGKSTRGRHGGFYTTEYGRHAPNPVGAQHPWEECRGMGASFGYSRNEDIRDYKTADELVDVLVDTVSAGGNLLLDIGPTADGRIPVVMQERLLEIGAWLKVNGEAIYGSRPWRITRQDNDVVFTARDGAVYAICKRWPGERLVLRGVKAGTGARAVLLGSAQAGQEQPLEISEAGDGLAIRTIAPSPESVGAVKAYVFKLTQVE